MLCAMNHWGKDVMLTRRGLIACAAGLVVAQSARAGLTLTPPQTAGPFYPRIKPDDSDMDLSHIRGGQASAKGEIIDVQGRILSVSGHALRNAVVEIWQADADGRYHHPGDRRPISPDLNFQGFGSVRTGADGAYRFRTIRPAAYHAGPMIRTPHIHFRVVDSAARELVTQMYFPGEALNAQDFVFSNLSGNLARDAATARRGQGGEIVRYEFDLVLA